MSSETQSKEISVTSDGTFGGGPAKITSHWKVTPEQRQLAIDRIVGILADDNGTARNYMAAASILKAVVDTNIKIDEVADKIERLDSGRPTEISDPGTLGAAVADLANRVSGVIGNRPRNNPASCLGV